MGEGKQKKPVDGWKEQVIGVLFPRRCPVCGEIVTPKGALICPGCRGLLHDVKGSLCLKCGKELADKDGEYCLGCMRHPKSFVRGAALFNYNEVSAKSMVQIKYKNKREYLDFYSREMVNRLGEKIRGMHGEVLVPVPVHPERLRKRGFNQAQELALRISKLMGIALCTDLLIRSRKTAPQKELTPAQRLKNLEQAFQVNAESSFREVNSVILVDDIYTTGSTIEACTRVLRKAGIQKVYFLVLCIGGDR